MLPWFPLGFAYGQLPINIYCDSHSAISTEYSTRPVSGETHFGYGIHRTACVRTSGFSRRHRSRSGASASKADQVMTFRRSRPSACHRRRLIDMCIDIPKEARVRHLRWRIKQQNTGVPWCFRNREKVVTWSSKTGFCFTAVEHNGCT